MKNLLITFCMNSFVSHESLSLCTLYFVAIFKNIDMCFEFFNNRKILGRKTSVKPPGAYLILSLEGGEGVSLFQMSDEYDSNCSVSVLFTHILQSLHTVLHTFPSNKAVTNPLKHWPANVEGRPSEKICFSAKFEIKNFPHHVCVVSLLKSLLPCQKLYKIYRGCM